MRSISKSIGNHVKLAALHGRLHAFSNNAVAWHKTILPTVGILLLLALIIMGCLVLNWAIMGKILLGIAASLMLAFAMGCWLSPFWVIVKIGRERKSLITSVLANLAILCMIIIILIYAICIRQYILQIQGDKDYWRTWLSVWCFSIFPCMIVPALVAIGIDSKWRP